MTNLTNAVRSAIEINNIVVGSRKEYLQCAYGDNYEEVRTLNVGLGVLSWSFLLLDIKQKNGWKKTVANQVGIAAVTLAVNLSYNQEVQAMVKNLAA